ncbi:MAG: haloalkane dehalogenase [Thermoanaerobaculia bacterium]
MTEALRTPDDRFSALPGYRFEPRYLDDLDGFAGLRMHYLDEGPAEAAETFLCLHGQPTWSFLYRKMIPVFTAAGHRAVAPDFYGFGRSDKPVDEEVYSFDLHRRTLLAFIGRLDLGRITLVAQDWGGLIGLTLPMAMPERFSRMLLMNTILATGDLPLSQGFVQWRAWCRKNPDMDIAALMGRACPSLTEAERQAYAAPFPDIHHKAGVRRFPELVPEHPDDPGAALSRQARLWLAQEWAGESFLAVGARDPVLGAPAMSYLRRFVRNSPEPLILSEAGHFVQEWGEEVALAALRAFAGGEA